MTEPSIDELIDNEDWDAVARWCENFDAERAVRRPISDWWLRCAASDPESPDELVRTKVGAARADGVSWQRIGELLGLPEAEAQQRYDSPAEPS
ncbi:hypothetical protein [Candidatus Poriferisodalis sp.]|uniref:hypothetical protein n=1 Tax=Candidatus Poriferisodalis sp. TaxID=3101277 RepID=UPI003C702624